MILSMPEPIDETIPVPPRYWWLKRILIASAILLLGFVALRLWWGWYADRQLQAEIDRIVAAGEPIYPEDFDPKELIPDDQNAVTLIEQAINSFNGSTNAGLSLDDFLDKPMVFETDPASADELMVNNESVRTFVRMSRDKRTSVSWHQSSDMSQQRLLAKYLFFSATYFHLKGNDREAIESLHDIYWHAYVVNEAPRLLPQLVGNAIGSIVRYFCEEHGAQLDIESSMAEMAPSELQASRARVQELMNRLLDESTLQRHSRRAFFGERCEALQNLKKFESSNPSILFILKRPLYVFETMEAMASIEIAAKVDFAEGYLAFTKVLPDEPSPSLIESIARPYYSAFGTPGGSELNSLSLMFRLIADQRMAALSLAIRMYQIDYRRRPESLAELVPVYIAEIPRDPYAHDGAALRYWKEIAILYSVWVDGVDNRGTPRTKTKADGTWDYDGADLIFYLDGRPKD